MSIDDIGISSWKDLGFNEYLSKLTAMSSSLKSVEDLRKAIFDIDMTGTDITGAAGIFSGGLNINNAWHVDKDGNMWWGDYDNYDDATIKISAAGAINFTSGIISGEVKIGTPTDYFSALSNIHGSYLGLYSNSTLCINLYASAEGSRGLLLFHPGIEANAGVAVSGVDMDFWIGSTGGKFNFYGGPIVGDHPAYLKSPVSGYKMLRDSSKGFTTSVSPGISASWIYTYPEAFASATGLSIVAIPCNTAQPICVTIFGKTTTSCTLCLHRTDGANLSASTTYRCDILLVGP